MQHRIRRTVGEVLDIMLPRIAELVIGMEACDLKLLRQPLLRDGGIGRAQEMAVLDKLRQYTGMNQQRGFANGGICIM